TCAHLSRSRSIRYARECGASRYRLTRPSAGKRQALFALGNHCGSGAAFSASYRCGQLLSERTELDQTKIKLRGIRRRDPRTALRRKPAYLPKATTAGRVVSPKLGPAGSPRAFAASASRRPHDGHGNRPGARICRTQRIPSRLSKVARSASRSLRPELTRKHPTGTRLAF